MAFKFTSFIGVGYAVLQWRTVILLLGVPAFFKMFKASSTSLSVAKPVDIITGFFLFGRFAVDFFDEIRVNFGKLSAE